MHLSKIRKTLSPTSSTKRLVAAAGLLTIAYSPSVLARACYGTYDETAVQPVCFNAFNVPYKSTRVGYSPNIERKARDNSIITFNNVTASFKSVAQTTTHYNQTECNGNIYRTYSTAARLNWATLQRCPIQF